MSKRALRKAAKRFVRATIGKLGLEVVRSDKVLVPAMADLTRNLKGRVAVIFDVGANKGQSYTRFRGAFPTAQIHCFEPVRETFHALERNVGADSLAFLQHSAVGSFSGSAKINVARNSLASSFVASDDASGVEEVGVLRLDDYANRAGTEQIDLLKIDVEGHELSVLEGARNLLEAGKVRSVYVEVGLSDFNSSHVNFGKIYGVLSAYSFRCLGLYEIKYWFNPPFANAYFIHGDSALLDS